MSGVNKLEELHGIMPSHRLDHATRRSSCNPCKKSNRMLLGKKKKLPMSANRMVLYRRSRRCVARVVSRNLVVGTWLTDATVVELQRLLIFLVFASEVGAHWGRETRDLVRRLVRTRSLRTPTASPAATAGWRRRWWGVAAARSSALCCEAPGAHRRGREAIGSRH